MSPLAESLADGPGDTIYAIDWGIYEPVDFLLQGKAQLRESYPYLIPATPDPAQRRVIDSMLADPHAVFVSMSLPANSLKESANAWKRSPVPKATRKNQSA